MCSRIRQIGGIDEAYVHAALRCFLAEDLFRPGEAGLVDIGND